MKFCGTAGSHPYGNLFAGRPIKHCRSAWVMGTALAIKSQGCCKRKAMLEAMSRGELLQFAAAGALSSYP
jgi:hypothetical protein